MVKDLPKDHLDLIDPMLADGKNPDFLDTLDSEESARWWMGEKFDGHRHMIYIEEDGVHLISRGVKDVTKNVPQLQEIDYKSWIGTVIDVEAIAPTLRLDDTKSILGSRPETGIRWQLEHGILKLIAIDLPRCLGVDLMSQLFIARRKKLVDTVNLIKMPGLGAERLITLGEANDGSKVESISSLRKRYDEIVASGGEGTVLKDRVSPYLPGKRKGWIKIKRVETIDAIIMGYIPIGGKGVVSERVGHANTPGALKYGQYKDGELVEVGKVGGLTDEERLMFAKRGDELLGSVIEIEGQEIGKNGALRHPRFIRLRDDKQPKECKLEAKEMV